MLIFSARKDGDGTAKDGTAEHTASRKTNALKTAFSTAAAAAVIFEIFQVEIVIDCEGKLFRPCLRSRCPASVMQKRKKEGQVFLSPTVTSTKLWHGKAAACHPHTNSCALH